MAGVSPYMYEPVRPTNEEDNNYCADRDGRSNTNLITWCKCTFCERMPDDHECYCCRESQAFDVLRGNDDCITYHESFNFLILNIDSLKTAKYHMSLKADAVKRRMLSDETNRVWRHVAYTQFIYWVNAWVPLGKKERRVVPACVVAKIRDKYPEVDNVYQGFLPAEGKTVEYFD